MASFRELDRKLKQLEKKFFRKAEQNVKKAVTRSLQVAVFATRVDTGTARGGWVISVGRSTPNVTTSEDPGGFSTLGRGQTAIAKFKLKDGVMGNLYNNIEYILFLDRGGPNNVPDNMVAKAVQAAQSFLSKQRYLS